MTRARTKNGISRDTTNRLRNAYGRDWRRHYTPQLPPPTPLGAIWRVILEQADLWPGPGGLPANRKAVYEDRFPCTWVEDPAPFLLLLGRYPPYFQADGTYAAGVDPAVRRETARIKMKLYTQPNNQPPRSGWAGVLFGTAELLCPPATWSPAVAAAFAHHSLLHTPTPQQVAQQFLASPEMAILPYVNTADPADCDDLAALTFHAWGVSFEQMARAHAPLPADRLGAKRQPQDFEAAAQRATMKIMGSPAFFIWASGIDATSLPISPQDAEFINHGIRPDWTVSERNKALFATRNALNDFTAPLRPTNLASPFEGYTWDSVEQAIRDPASHLAHAYKLWSSCSGVIRRVLDLSARPAEPTKTPIPVKTELAHTKKAPYPLSRPETTARLAAVLATGKDKTRYKLTRNLR